MYFWEICCIQIKIQTQTSIEPKHGAFYSNNEVRDHTLSLGNFSSSTELPLIIFTDSVIESPCTCVCPFVCVSVCAIRCSFFRGLSLALRSHDQFQASNWSTPPFPLWPNLMVYPQIQNDFFNFLIFNFRERSRNFSQKKE